MTALRAALMRRAACGAAAVISILLAEPAFAHSGELTVQPATTLMATFTVGSASNGSASSTVVGAFATDVEVNYPPHWIKFGRLPSGPGLVMSMADVAFSDPSIGTFSLTGWALDLVTPGDFPGAPLAEDGSFALAEHELRIDRGELTGTLVGLGPFHRSFSSDPLTLLQFAELTGIATGDTGTNGDARMDFNIPFDHLGSLVGSSGAGLDVAIEGRLVADGSIEAIPEPSVAALFIFGIAVLGAHWRGRSQRLRAHAGYAAGSWRNANIKGGEQ